MDVRNFCEHQDLADKGAQRIKIALSRRPKHAHKLDGGRVVQDTRLKRFLGAPIHCPSFYGRVLTLLLCLRVPLHPSSLLFVSLLPSPTSHYNTMARDLYASSRSSKAMNKGAQKIKIALSRRPKKVHDLDGGRVAQNTRRDGWLLGAPIQYPSSDGRVHANCALNFFFLPCRVFTPQGPRHDPVSLLPSFQTSTHLSPQHHGPRHVRVVSLLQGSRHHPSHKPHHHL
ncbi:uncharacterized protein J3D65DRAFT_635406 [Phyllosticta citribraziliensis]|uniref:Uncharacterized protein n=1 Tax=Phyllosticta citribraziliensis TaxID=989973 RepID=A0ABR1LDS4_9PEZI